ncbi:helix-turn-helix domain-containing protein [Streptomyces sp. NPDC059679]|uniref:helix-turn-helix domain-containing protein n=1 Tax=Streptomyces sp. NPDC059679 TaxID=3346903 RepID=UPI003688F5E9
MVNKSAPEPASNLWTHPRLAAAAGDENWQQLFRVWRQLTGTSQTRLGALVGLAQSDVSEIERGRRRVTSTEVRQRIIEGLSIPVELFTGGVRPTPTPVPSLRSDSLAPDPDLLDRLTQTVASPTRVDHTTLDWLERLLAEHRRAEDTLGSRPLIGMVRRQLDTVTDLYAGASGELATRVVRLASEHAQFLAWMAEDQGNAPVALTWYDRSSDWALEALDPNMAATALSMKSHLAWSAGNARRCIRLAQAAGSAYNGTSLGMQGMAVQMEARGQALSGDANTARHLLDKAQHLINRAAEEPEDEPPWMYFYGENWFTLQRGMAELHLRRWNAAADFLRTGISALPAQYRRDRSRYRAYLAHALAAAGHFEEATQAAFDFIADATTVSRPHAWNELHTTAALLLGRGAPQARTLVDALRDY